MNAKQVGGSSQTKGKQGENGQGSPEDASAGRIPIHEGCPVFLYPCLFDRVLAGVLTRVLIQGVLMEG
jgi:hypothetical protein